MANELVAIARTNTCNEKVVKNDSASIKDGGMNL